MERETILEVKEMSKVYESQSGRNRVLDKVNVNIKKGGIYFPGL